MIHTFRNSIADSEKLRALYQHCVHDLKLPGDYDDLLRMAFIYCLSALDKLVHDMVTHHMVEIFAGRRPPTPKYLAETISLESHSALYGSGVPPAEIVFEGIVRRKFAHLSFMDPVKLVDALSLIWPESQKWQVIAAAMGRDRSETVTELRNIHKRRNSIVHETDRGPNTDLKMPILAADAERAESFVSSLGETIFTLI
ncbi:MAG: hypothetical protein JJU27_06065 [Gammaproteobacteria bacterium]|nr:hypothetical protein [Gammaproteobacteria bacterium]